MMFVGILGLLVTIAALVWLVFTFIKNGNRKKPLITFVVGLIMFISGLAFSGDTKTNSSETNGSEVSSVTEKDILQDYVSYAKEVALPIEDIQSVILKDNTMVFTFDYNGQFGKYMQKLREINEVDNRLKDYFDQSEVKKVQLKSDEGNMILSYQYGVEFIN
ncbi:hypothetical protein IGJ48_001272 [Enterococcus pernyi]